MTIPNFKNIFAWRVALLVAVFGICLCFVAFEITASQETEEEDQLAIPPARSAADTAWMTSTFVCTAPSPVPQSCGVERWSVKTGSDTTTPSINLNSVTPTTVTALRAFAHPATLPANSRVAPAETTAWVVNGTLTVYKLESDSDYHMVIQDGAGNTFVTEIPYPGASPACVTADSPFLPGIASARCKFDGSGLPRATTSFQTANVPVRAVGVGMFDFAHGQTGAAPNQIEMHAILDIAFPKTVNTVTGLGNNVNVQLGDAALTFNNVLAAGTTTSVPIEPSTVGTASPDQTLVGPAYDLSTTATVNSPVGICISVPYITDATAFSKLKILDLEGGTLVDRTTFVNSSQSKVCGSLPSLSKVVVSVGTVASPTGTHTAFDFDGDAKTDIGIFRPVGANGAEWWYQKSSDGTNYATQFGAATDKVVAADFTGDGKSDIAFFRPSTGQWYVLRSEDSSFYSFPFGASGDIPVPADFDGDGKADAAVFRPSTATWYISNSSGGTTISQFGLTTDLAVPGDYDGDGKADIAVYRPTGANGAEWWIAKSSGGTFATQFGAATDKAVPGDYTGDGKTDVAIWKPATGQWFILRSEDITYYAFPFGAAGDAPVPGDYDGDGKTDAGVFRASNSTWYINRSTAGVLIQAFGTTGDVPLSGAFVR